MRDDATLTLQRVLLAGEALAAPATQWIHTFDAVLLPLLSELAQRQGGVRSFTPA